jgi:hypothetical protein
MAPSPEVSEANIRILIEDLKQVKETSDGMVGPLVSPSNIVEVARLIGIDLQLFATPIGGIIRVIRGFLKYMTRCEIVPDDIYRLQEDLKDAIERSHLIQEGSPINDFQERFVSGGAHCVECEKFMAMVICKTCLDAFCEGCFQKVHSKGNRSSHDVVRLRICDYCIDRSARVECTTTGKSCCYECYSMKHINLLQACKGDQKPRRISYDSLEDVEDKSSTPSWTSGEEWIPFFDRHGILFYYNFKTSESLRRNPLDLFQDDLLVDSEYPISEESSDVVQRISRYTVK